MTTEPNVTKDELKAVMNLAIGKKSVVLAYVLWFFLGGFGAHRFYLGKTLSAIIMLVLTLVGLFTLPLFGFGVIFLSIVGIWWVIDAVLIFLAASKSNSKIDKAIDSI